MPGSFPAAGDVVEVRLLSFALGQVGLNVLHYGAKTTVTGGCSLQELANSIDGNIHVPYKSLLSSNALWRGVGARNLISPKTVEYVANSHNGVGSSGAGILPTQVRGLISYITTLSGPANRGRSYIPFPSGADSTVDGVPSSSYQARLATLASLIVTTFTVVGATGSTTWEFGIRHKVGGPFAVTYNPGLIIRAKWATQRRSGAYGRLNNPPF